MKGLEFPIVGTKKAGFTKKFDLNSPEGRSAYFQEKVGHEIGHLSEYLKHGTFLAYFLGKKNSGKGTYSKLLTEIFGEDKLAHVSVGDVVRDVHNSWEEYSKSPKYDELKKLYRGYISFEDAVDAFLGRSTEKLLPTEFILALMKQKIKELEGKAIFVDGLPREMDQVSYALYFRDLINYRDDPDMFILIDIPESVIDERIKYRVICPECNTSRNLKLLVTSKPGYDEKSGKYYLKCDNPTCSGPRMVKKEGDEAGIDPIRPRLEKDDKIIRTVFDIHGVPKVLLRNHVPAADATKYFDDYEITPEYILKWDKESKKVSVSEKSWTVKDDNGVESYSLLAPPVVVGLIKQLVEALAL